MKAIPILRHVPHEPAGTLETALTEASIPFGYVDLFQHVPEQLDVEGLPGLVVMGGPMNVDETDQYPFLAAEVGWLRRAVAANVPVMGICLGAQLLAKALGAKVYPMGRIAAGDDGRDQPLKEIGWYDIGLTSAATDDPLFGPCFSAAPPREPFHRLTVFHWHGDTFDLPPGAVHLAASGACRNQAFRFGPNAWGLQFHIEMTAEMIEDWLRVPGMCGELAVLDYVDPAEIRARTPEELPKLQSLARGVLGRFAAICTGDRSRRT